MLLLEIILVAVYVYLWGIDGYIVCEVTIFWLMAGQHGYLYISIIVSWGLCIYVPVHPTHRSTLWNHIVDGLPLADSWIVGGDFNNVTTV